MRNKLEKLERSFGPLPSFFPAWKVGAIFVWVLLFAAIVQAQTFTNNTAFSNLGVGGDKEGGIAWGDFNNDGCLDVLINTFDNTLQTRLYVQGRSGSICTGVFADVTTCLAPGLEGYTRARERSVIWGDIDNDGDLDFAINASPVIEIWKNNGPGGTSCPNMPGTWSRFGISTGNQPNQRITSFSDPANTFVFNVEFLGFVDYDQDGDLDLIADNHDNGIIIFQNDGMGTFTDIDPTSVGLPGAASSFSGDFGTVADFDDDGDVDILIRKESVGSTPGYDLWVNDGTGNYAANSGFNEEARNINKGGAIFCDFDNDGDFDIFWTDYGTAPNQIYRQDAGGVFTATGEPGNSSGFTFPDTIDGAACGDYDNDGDLDLFVSTDGFQDYMFRNDNPATLQFTRVTSGMPAGAADGEGVTFVDYDRDGDLDVYINQDGGNELWRNNTDNTNYLVVRALRDLGGGVVRDDIGATIKLVDCSDGSLLSYIPEVNGGKGHGSQDPPYVHFGLPTALGDTHVYIVRVRFTSGAVRDLAVQPAALSGYRLVQIRDTDLNNYDACPKPTRVRMAWAMAQGGPDGVLLRWRTAWELDNIGFHVYREAEGRLERLTRGPLPGSALLHGMRAEHHAGQTYRFHDGEMVRGVRYWLEAIDVHGATTWYGPLAVVWQDQPVAPGGPLGERKESHDSGMGPRRFARMRLRTVSRGGVPFPMTPIPEQAALRELPEHPRRMRIQRWLAGRDAIKIEIRREGWYQIWGRDLLAAGWSARVDPWQLRLYAEGRAWPLYVRANRNHRLDAEDRIEFYATGLDAPGSATRIYWLVPDGGKRLGIRSRRAGGYPLPWNSFLLTTEYRERLYYIPTIRNGDRSNFFGPLISPDPVTVSVDLHHLDPRPPGPALLEVVLQGWTDLDETQPDHVVRVRLNGWDVGRVTFDGTESGRLTVPVDPGVLREGRNEITFQAQGGAADYAFLERVRLHYWHAYHAEQGKWLRFAVPWGTRVTVRGFHAPRIRVVDITDPYRPFFVKARARRHRDGTWSIQVGYAGRGVWQRTFLAFTADAVRTPAALRRNRPSQWHHRKHRYVAVLVAHRVFWDAARDWARARRQQGWNAVAIDVEDLYDEFSYGVHDARALIRFVRNAWYRWRERPRYLLLLGDASFDPRNYLGLGAWDFVPTWWTETQTMETAWDDGFGDINGDGLPEVVVGRVPVRTRAEAETVMAKMLRATEPSGPGLDALLVSDARRGFDFPGVSEDLGRDLAAAGYTRQEWVSMEQEPLDRARSHLFAAWQSGVRWVQFLGHGSVEIWSPQLLGPEDMARLHAPEGMWPVVVSLTCLNGFFHDVYTESLAERLLKTTGGARAVWASSGFTDPPWQVVLARVLYRTLQEHPELTLGEAVVRAKRAVKFADVRRTWILFGDPLLRVHASPR